MNEVYRRRLETGSQQRIAGREKQGRAIARQLIPIRSAQEVAVQLNIKRQSVDRIAAGALLKVYMRMKELVL